MSTRPARWLAKFVGHAMTSGGRTGESLRAVIAPRLHAVPSLKTRLLDGVTPALSHSPLVARRAPWRPLNGQLCPNATIESEVRLDDESDGGYLLLTTESVPTAVCSVAHATGMRITQVDTISPLGRWLRHGRVTTALIRPDGTVANAGNDPLGIARKAPHFTPRTTRH